MSLLDDARRMEERARLKASCWFCGAWQQDQHAEECPVLSLPKIVAALAAAQAVLNASDDAASLNWSTSIPRPVVKALYGLERALGDEAP